MSKNREERIVEMRFENKEFESGVDQTLSTLDKLEQKLQFKGSEAGMANLESKAKSFDMSNMGNAAESVTNKFSALEVAGLAAIASIAKAATDAAVNIGKHLINKYIIKPISDGFQEYELIQNTIQTIYTNTKNKGTTIEEIEAGLDDLNTYADQTIYVMSDMTKAIGQFTNAGVNFADSKKAVIGFANLAAAVGATNEQLARVEYQSSQAMSAGVFRLMDWNSIQNSPLGGEYFQKALIKNAKEYYAGLSDAARDSLGLDKGSVKTILEGLDDMENGLISFRQSFSKQKGDSFYSDWLRSDIFTETLKQFAEDPELYEAATSVRTFTKMRETLEEAAGSGWAQTWKLIVGDFGESKALWTDVSKTLSLIIDGIGDGRNEVISFWKEMGGRDDVIQALKNAMEALIRILRPIKEAFDEVLSPYLKQYLLDLSSWLEEITGKMLIGEETAEGIKAVFKVIFTIAKWVLIIADKVSKIVGGAVFIVSKAVGDVFQLIGKITKIPEKVEDAWNNIKTFLAKHGINIPTKGLEDYNKEIDKTTDKTDELKDKLTKKEEKSFGEGLFSDGVVNLFTDYTIFDKIRTNLDNFRNWLTGLGQKIKEFFKNQDLITKEKITDFFGKIVELGSKIPGVLRNGWSKLVEIWQGFKQSPEFQKFIDSLKELGKALLTFSGSVINKAIDLFNKFYEGLKDPEKKAERAKKMSEALTAIGDAIKIIADFVTPAVNGLKELFEGFAKNISGEDTNEIEETAEAIDDLSDATNNFGDAQEETQKKTRGGFITGNIGPNFNKTKKQTNKWIEFYNKFAEAHGGKGIIDEEKEPSIFEKIFGSDTEYLKKAMKTGGVIGAIAVVMVAVVEVIRLIDSLRKASDKLVSNVFEPIKKFLEDGVDLFGLKAFAKTIKAREKAKKFRDLAIGIAMIAGSIALLAIIREKVDAKYFWQAAALVGIIAFVMEIIITTLGALPLTELDKVSKALAAFGVAIALIAGSIVVLGYLMDHAEDPSSYMAAAIAVGAMMVLLGLMLSGMMIIQKKWSGLKEGLWQDVLSVAAAVYIIAKAIERISDIEVNALRRAIGALIVIFGGLDVVFLLASKLDKGVAPDTFLRIGSMIKALGICMLLLAVAVKIFAAVYEKDPMSYLVGMGSVIIYILGLLSLISLFPYKNVDIRKLESIALAAILLGIAVDAIIPAVAAFSILAHFDLAAMLWSIGTVAAIIAAATLIPALASKISKGNADDVLIFAGSMIMIAFAMNLFAKAILSMQLGMIKQIDTFMLALAVIGEIIIGIAFLTTLFATFPEASVAVGIMVLLGVAIGVFAVDILTFAKAIDKFADGIKKLSKITDQDLENIKKNIIKFCQDSYDVWVAVAASFVAGVHVFRDALEEAGPDINYIIGWFIDVIGNHLETKLKTWGNTLGTALGDLLLQVLGKAISYTAEHTMDILNLLDALVLLWAKFVNNAIIKFVSLFAGLAPILDPILTIITGKPTSIASIIHELHLQDDALEAEINRLTNFDFGAPANNVEKGMTVLSKALSGNNDNNGLGFSITLPEIDFGPLQTEIEQYGISLPTDFSSILTYNSGLQVPGAGQDIAEDADSGLQTGESLFSTTGGQMIKGLVATMTSKLALTTSFNAGYAVTNAVVKGARAGAQVKSPSRETIYIANMMNKGLVDTLTASIPEARMTGYEYASAVVGGIKDASTDALDTKPSITPVLRSDAVSKELSSITGVLNTSRTMSVATTAKLAARDATVMRKAAADMRAMNTYDDSKVVDNIANLGEHVDKLGTSIEGMGFYMDGKKVGRIVSPTVNRAFYTDSIRKGRNN